MKWYFINTGSNTGDYNMKYDLELAQKAIPGEAYFRLYRWKPYCISLGANQLESSINAEKVAADNIDIVKRPTGGRAILHAEEITYSVVFPIESNTSARNLYHQINLALLNGLKKYSPKLDEVDLENIQPNFNKFYKEEKSSICFAVSAKSELKFRGKKLVGSAQRKLGNSILQHGSILCGNYHEEIVKYLSLPTSNSLKIKNEISDTTTFLEEILGQKIDYKLLENSLIEGFQEHFNTSLISLNENQFEPELKLL